MRANQFQSFLSNLHKLSPVQIKQLRVALEANEVVLRTYSAMQEATGGLCCHHCGSQRVVKNGFENGLQRFRCKECGRSSNCVTGTPLSRLRNKEKFATYAHCLEQGLTLRQAAQKTQLNLDRAFRWRHRFLQADSVKLVVNNAKSVMLQGSGIVRMNVSAKQLASAVLHPKKMVVRFSGLPVPATNQINGEFAGAKSALAEQQKAFMARNLESRGDFQMPCISQLVITAKKLDGSALHRVPLMAASGIYGQEMYIDGWLLQEWLQRKMRGVASKYLPHYLAWQRMRTWHPQGLNAEQILHSALSKRVINV